MYLPTYWKLVSEYRIHVIRNIVGWTLPATFLCIEFLMI
jgi:hypothetical protein